MPIQKGDVKLVKSAVMDDVPEGGGAPTATVIVDGTSNAIFPDVSETDRAAGRVSLRKAHVWVQSTDTDTYLGGNVIVAEPPNDPNVSITIFSGNDTFDTRSAAVSRLEAYLNVGANYPGYLFSNHITGQATLQIVQRTDAMPGIGDSLALTKREGFSDQAVQYVRVTDAKVVLTTFTDGSGDYTRYVLTLKLSDPLRYDFPGFDASRVDPTKAQLAAGTKVSNVVVADAADYSGVQPLAVAAGVGDFSVKAAGIYTQLVPSAQIETPIGDARTNQVSTGVNTMGTPVVASLTLAFNTTQSLYIGGAITPGSLSIVNGAVTVTDSGGRLMSAGTQVGLVDYDNGIVSLTTNVFGAGSLTFAVTYTPGGSPTAVNQTQGFDITIATRSTSYVRTFQPAPQPGSLSIAYMVASRWYVLRDDGSGACRGADSSYGAATVNFTTGTVVVTLGALPDVGSQLIFQWVDPTSQRAADVIQLDQGSKLYWPFNTAGTSAVTVGTDPITPGYLSITWTDGVLRTVTDDGKGNLQGYGSGQVDYAAGVIRLSPQVLPPVGTTINVATKPSPRVSSSVTVTSTGTNLNLNLGATNIVPGTVAITAGFVMQFMWFGLSGTPPLLDWGGATSWLMVDDAAGNLLLQIGNTKIAIGTINYAAGTGVIAINTPIYNNLTATPAQRAMALSLTAFDNVSIVSGAPVWQMLPTS